MILRRFMQHIKEQNWFAVGLDIIVVIVGIFLGMKATEWNDELKQAEEWRLALDNLATELTVNIDTIGKDQIILEEIIDPARQTLIMLLNCKIEASDYQTLDRGLQSMRGAVGLAIRTRALETVLTDTRFQSYLTANKREYLQELITWLEFIESEAGFFENLPFDDLPEKNDSIKLVASSSETKHPFTRTKLSSDEFTQTALAVPFEEACQDISLIKSIEWWVKWQSRQQTVAGQLVERLVESKNEIQGW